MLKLRRCGKHGYNRGRLYFKRFKQFADYETYKLLLREIILHRRPGSSCPHCGSSCVVKYGMYKDRQRYKCKACCRTFNDLTNTPLHGTHYTEKWAKFLQCMREGHSLRHAAILLHVSYVTLFYWRHKIINALKFAGQADSKPIPIDCFPLKGKYVCVSLYPPSHLVTISERKSFESWIRPFDWIASKYLTRYISWFRYHEKYKQVEEFQSMKEMLLQACSANIGQTYQSVCVFS